ncbi:cell division control protein [Tremella mesenterica]|uniref:Cell division control protein n=1 Tax=Tremella mesenterica TaxID=5217 RepID=A0A4Q1BNW4_TREME|nr:cell division control protein [Tremella mesenterica]
MLADSSITNIPADVSNPFIAKVPPSPPKQNVVSDPIAVLREGMGRMDITSRGSSGEYVNARKEDSNVQNKRELDRFVPSRPTSLHQSSHSSTTLPTLALETPDTSTSLDISSSSLSASLGLQSNRRILSFRSAPPPASHATSHLDAQRAYLVHSSASASRGTTTSGPGAAGTKKRSPPHVPDRVLDAPGFANDYYLNLVDWSCGNHVAIGLADIGYVWDAGTGAVNALGTGSEEQVPVTAVSWSPDGAYLAIGNDKGEVEIWDVEEGKKMRVMGGHQARIPVLSWNGHVLSSGCRDGSIYHHDVRVSRHKVMELLGHSGEVCGLKWRSDGQLLASGGNDNVVNCWDGRVGQSVLQTGEGIPKGVAKWTKRNHSAAVKALAWCPWQSNLLATGGGSTDQTIHFWSSTTGARTASLPTSSQVTSLIWSPHAKELLSTHGYPDNNLILWTYPSLSKVYDVPAHDERILCSALSPDGCMVATGAGDENLKFWKVWEMKSAPKKSSVEEEVRGKVGGRIR